MRLMQTSLTLALMLSIGCSADKGDAGPDGQDGAAGEDGQSGAEGTPGADGEDGLPCWDLDEDGEADPEEDTNGDGSVDVEDCRPADGDDEDEARPYLGDLTLDSDEAGAFFCEHYDRVYGDLIIDGSMLYNFTEDVSCLRAVYGDLRVEAFGDLSLPLLQHVEGDMEVKAGNTEVIEFPALESIFGSLTLMYSHSIEIRYTADFPVLGRLLGDLKVLANVHLEAINLPSLTEVSGELEIYNNDWLEDLDGLSALESISDNLSITWNDALTDIGGLGSVEYVGGDVEIVLNAALSTTHAQAVVDGIDTVDGEVMIEDNLGD
jgi:hypothetical protein